MITAINTERVAIFALFAVLMITIWSYKSYSGIEVVKVDDCELSLSSCSVETEGGRLTLSISPRPIRPLKPLQAVVTLQGFEAEKVELLLTGVDVDMGRFFYPLKRGEDGRFESNVTLSICSQSRMTWQAMVIIDGKLKIPFQFESEYKSQFMIVE